MALLVYLDHRQKQLSPRVAGKALRWRLLVEVVTGAALLVIVGAIWFAGMFFLIDRNNESLPKGSNWHFVLLVPTVVWFFLGPFTAIKASKALQKALARRFDRS